MNDQDIRIKAYLLWQSSYKAWQESARDLPFPDSNYFWYLAEYEIRHGGQ